jgi:hypothetical protein
MSVFVDNIFIYTDTKLSNCKGIILCKFWVDLQKKDIIENRRFDMEIIRISWEGPHGLKDIGYDFKKEKYCDEDNNKLNDMNTDYGLYQVYGNHPIYGNNVLLYIGKADRQTFKKRLSQEGWEYNFDSRNIQFYVGRLFGKEKPTEDEWSKEIEIAENMLIYSHEPARNSSNILNISRNDKKLKKFENIRILNYDDHRSLMSEVSGELWIKTFDGFGEVYSVRQ